MRTEEDIRELIKELHDDLAWDEYDTEEREIIQEKIDLLEWVLKE